MVRADQPLNGPPYTQYRSASSHRHIKENSQCGLLSNAYIDTDMNITPDMNQIIEISIHAPYDHHHQKLGH